ncbi:MAG: glutamate--tRNA ligase [Arcobacter sp.]|nr:glutamate--tRNA ligase [Arcobacter sp.]
MLRFAPSPTSDMGIESLRVAIFNYIVAKQLNEDLVIRIEDIDKEKNIEGKDKEILEILSLFSIDYLTAAHQSDSLKYHQKMAMQLLTKKKAFSCFCGDAKLKELEEEAKAKNKPFVYDGFCATLSDEAILEVNAPFTVRINKPEESIKFNNILKGDFDIRPDEVDAFNILKHDKTPTYDYACAIDDMLMDISFIIRNEKYISNTAKQIHIRNSLGYTKEIKYAHLANISNIPDFAYSVKSLIDKGFLPSAIANYLVLLGNETPKEIFTLEEAIQWFKLENLCKETIDFDIEKLKFINKKHLEQMDEMRLSKLLGFADLDIGKLAKLYLEEVSTLKELKSRINSIFEEKTTCKGFENEFTKIKTCLQDASYYDDFNELSKYITKETGLKDESLTKPLRYLLTGEQTGPDISNIYVLIKNYLGEIVK